MIIPSIDLQAGQTVQLIGGRDPALEAGDPRPWAERFGRVGEVAVVDLDAALGRGENRALIRELLPLADCRVGGGIRDMETALDWLDAGASKIVLGTAARVDLLRQLPRERVIAALDAHHGEVVVEGWTRKTGRSVLDRIRELRDYVGGFLVTFVEREGRLQGLDLEAVGPLREACGSARLTVAGGVTTAEEIAALDRAGVDAQVGMALYTNKLRLGEAFAAPLQSDRADGLWPTIVCDETGSALGLAWSDAESLDQAVERGIGCYHSRKRGLWIKGKTSGATQQLLAIDLDCDRDALRFTVRQAAPGFCHLERDSCWGEARGLRGLQRTLASRKQNAELGSYSARLFADPALLRDKLTEEAAELNAARTRDEVVWEAADVLYFTLTRLEAEGVPLSEVERELDRRARFVRRRLQAPSPNSNEGTSAETVDIALREPLPTELLPERDLDTLCAIQRVSLDSETLAKAEAILDTVRREGESAVRRFAARFEELSSEEELYYEREQLQASLRSLEPDMRAVLERTAARIRRFAEAQRQGMRDLSLDLPEGGRAGHSWKPLQRVGCYAPGGRYPLPSSVLMTVIPAKVAGVEEVLVASPDPGPLMQSAAALAGADRLLRVGGAHAIAALAFGIGNAAACQAVVGPGNRWVTAAKQLLAGEVSIDMPAGPSELVIVADDKASAGKLAHDLIAVAEHDPDALPILISSSRALMQSVRKACHEALRSLPTATVAAAALTRGGCLWVADHQAATRACNVLAPEHLSLAVADPRALHDGLRNYGALFLGGDAAEVFGDYGLGPNHVLPTGGRAGSFSGLSVANFLRLRSWIEGGPQDRSFVEDVACLARSEGLEGHARAAEMRL